MSHIEIRSTPPPIHFPCIPTKTGTLHSKTFIKGFCKSRSVWYNFAECLAMSCPSKSPANKLPNYLRSKPAVKTLPSAKRITTLRFSFLLSSAKIVPI